MAKEFLLSEKFKLEISWEEVLYEREGFCRFKGACFSGPVLQMAHKLENNDYIMLDFYSQYIHLVNSVYVAKFSWGQANYNDGDKKVYLEDAVLVHSKELNNVPSLKDTDYFVVDTSNHESSIHQYNLVYKTYLLGKDNDLYRFEK